MPEFDPIKHDLIIKHMDLIKRKISLWSTQAPKGLRFTFAEDWDSIGNKGEKIKFGRQFKNCVEGNLFPEIEWKDIAKSGRMDVYIKNI